MNLFWVLDFAKHNMHIFCRQYQKKKKKIERTENNETLIEI